MADETTTTTSSVEQIAQSVAQAIATQTGAEVELLAGGVNGSFTIAITYGTATYELTLTVPTDPNTQEYVFSLKRTQGETATEVASFRYKTAENWRTTVALPTTVVLPGGASIKTLTFSIGKGALNQ